MIITLTRYIFLVLLISVTAQAKKVDISFEILNAPNKYMDIARERALLLNDDGFKCYIVKGKEKLSLRCNDSKSTEEMQKNISLLKEKKIKFSILNKEDVKTVKEYKTLNEFYLGYIAFDKGDYKKAEKIFKYNYEKENNYQHAYAYALSLHKRGKHLQSLNILKVYTSDQKAKKFYNDILSTHVYKELKNKNYKNAYNSVEKYAPKNLKLKRIIYKQELNDSIAVGKYTKAQRLMNQYHLGDKSFDIDYMRALDMMKDKNYVASNQILTPYLNKEKKAKSLYMSNIIADASIDYENKDYKAALDKLEPYKNSSKKVQTFYNDIQYNRLLRNGWELLEKNPKSALVAFKASCKIKKEYACYSGMMYSYYKQDMHTQSLYLANKLYKIKANDELSTLAMRSSIELKDYQAAKSWYNKTKNKENLTSPYLLEIFQKVDNYIKTENYTEADNIIEYLKHIYPNNIEVLKYNMQLSLLQKKYDEAQNIAQEILLLDSSSVEAKYTFALYEFEKQDYKGCSNRLASLTLTQPYQQQLKYRCDAYAAVVDKDINKAIDNIEKIEDKDIQAAFYIDIGDMYKSINNTNAIDAYRGAKNVKTDNFDVELTYLYSLKDFAKDQQLDEELQKAYSKYPDKSDKLDEFSIAYEKERLYSYYQNKRYNECYNYANTIEEKQNDKDVYRMAGWCAYHLNKFDKAKEKFAIINKTFGENSQDIYAYALSAYQNKEPQRAVDALDRITVIDSEKQTRLIAGLYMDLEEQGKAKELLNELDPSKERDALLVNINKSYTRPSHENSASIGMHYKSQTGIEGHSRFQQFILPVDYDYYAQDNDYHLYFDGDLMYLYNGYLSDNGGSYLDFGLGTNTQDNALAKDIGFMPKLGIDYKNFRAEIGTTPIGAKIDPELTWLLSGYITLSNWTGTLSFVQKEIDETMLSFVGETAKEGTQDVYWGRMLKRGVEAGISYDSAVNIGLNIAYYPEIYGKNVEKNSEIKASLTAIYHPKVESLSYLDVGAIVSFDSYDKNSNLFTYGHGGYFSPQEFFLGGIFTKFGDIVNNNLYYQSQLGLGFEGFIVEDVAKFPLKDGVVNSNEIAEGYRDGGVVYKGAIQVGYKINPNLDFILGLGLERINNYQVQEASFALVYRFDKMNSPTFNTFGLNHRVNQIIK